MLIPSRFSLIKVEALETSSGLKVGDHIVFGGFRRIDEKIEPVKSGTITDINYLCDFGIAYYRLTVECNPNPEHIHQIEGAESYFQVPAPVSAPADPFDKSFEAQYAMAKFIGESRYGSACQHSRTSGGICLDCQRKVI